MSLTLLKMTLKKNFLLGLIFASVLFLYSFVMISMFSPDSLEALNAMFKVLPPDVMKALGFSSAFSTLEGYLASWLYGLIMTAFPMIYCIILGTRLVAKTVDSGSMACLLATPNSRSKIIVTKGFYAIFSMAVIMAVSFGANLLAAKILFPETDMDVSVFFRLNLTVALANMVVMAITFFFSCLFNDARRSSSFGSSVPILFLLLNMLGNVSPDMEILKDFSIYGWYDPVGITNGDSTWEINLIFAGMIVVLFAAGVLIFRKKRLPI